jgi:putative hemolysin
VYTGPGGLVLDALGAAAVTVLGSFFAAADAALREIPEARLQALSQASGGSSFQRYVRDPPRVLSRWLVGRVVALSVASVLLNDAAHSAGLVQWALPVAVLGAVATYGTFTEVALTLARRIPERIGELALWFLRPVEWVAAPLADPLAFLGRAVGRRVPKTHRVDPRMTETEVEWVVAEGEKAGAIANEPAEMIRKVLDFKDLTARDVMVPRLLVRGVEASTPLADVAAFVANEKHSRYPVYREHIDHVVGLLYAKDLFALVRDGRLGAASLRDVMRTPVLFVSESQSAAKILEEMRVRRLHVAIVSDEFGGTAGLVTREDVVAEIVGEIHDKRARAAIQTTGDGRVVADASVPLADLSRALGKTLPEDGEFESLGGLIVSRAGRVPNVGTTLQISGMNFIVREADSTHVVKVEIVDDRPASNAPTLPG